MTTSSSTSTYLASSASECERHGAYLLHLRSQSFDYSSLGSVGTLMNRPSFTSKGTKYYHLFNISLCGEDRRAVCTDNVTVLSSADSQRETGESTNVVESFICQSTIIPSSGRGFRTALSSQSISSADTFLGEYTQQHTFLVT
ncbi:unnamed protein product [Oncorhynchus mykiss]|uniref:MRH domain-containing protein n=1 Tax=Oncorhynchus mykiss TaxID=8022 RepID=A0A060Z6S3_ONCMY|nr:unnamed protein product [Oncorhynchus mykiss]